MILVVGSVIARDGLVDDAIKLSLQHVHRSRLEAGCIAHAVHRDCENPNRLVFVEEWQDDAALRQHFKVAESRAFVMALAKLATEAPVMAIYEAARVGP